MQRTVDMILGLTAAVATALLLGLIARDDVGMSADMIHIDALSVAGIIFAAVASGFLLSRKSNTPSMAQRQQHGGACLRARGRSRLCRARCLWPDSIRRVPGSQPRASDADDRIERVAEGSPLGELGDHQYLCKHGLDQFYPKDAEQRATIDSALLYLVGTLYPYVARATYPKLNFPQYPGEVGHSDANDACKETARQAAAAAIAEPLEVFHKFYMGGNPFIGGDTPSIADIRLASTLEFLDVKHTGRRRSRPQVRGTRCLGDVRCAHHGLRGIRHPISSPVMLFFHPLPR
jgi:hypothetical protein